MDDDFIKEKLNMITKDDEILEVPAPESLKALNKEYAQKFAKAQENKQKVRRKYLIPVVSSCAAAVLVCVALLCFSFFSKTEEETRYGSYYKYAEEKISYAQIEEEYDILLYFGDCDILSCYVTKNTTLNKIVSITVTYQLPDGELQLTNVIDADYKYSEAEYYDKLTDNSSTDLFEFNYMIFSEDKTALATCDYNNYTYYFRYSSAYPEDITIIMNSMRV